MEYKVKIDAFEGPLDLLLHLIKQMEIDIYDIPVAIVTEQYLDYINRMKVLELDIASEFLVMAATLIEIKSKMLLPKPELLEDDIPDMEMEEDPREELMRRLIEYRQYKQVAEALKDREIARQLVYTKPMSNLAEYEQRAVEYPQISNVTLYDMLSSLQNLMKRKRQSRPLNTKIQRQEIPISKRMVEVLDFLERSNGEIQFTSLFPSLERSHIVVTFLAILELMKKQQIFCQQESNFNEIMIYRMEGAHPFDINRDEINY